MQKRIMTALILVGSVFGVAQVKPWMNREAIAKYLGIIDDRVDVTSRELSDASWNHGLNRRPSLRYHTVVPGTSPDDHLRTYRASNENFKVLQLILQQLQVADEAFKVLQAQNHALQARITALEGGAGR